MSALPDIDLSAIAEDQRDAVAALLQDNIALKGETASLKEIVKRLEHLVAELNHVVHGKKSEKLNEDDRQLAFEGEPMERQWSERHWRARPPSPRSRSRRTAGPRPMTRRAARRLEPGAIAAIFPRACPGSSGSSSPTA